MPNVKGKKFPYTAAGMKAAKKAMGMKHGGSVKAGKKKKYGHGGSVDGSRAAGAAQVSGKGFAGVF